MTPWRSKGAVKIAIGNTGGEALSALLADDVAAQRPADKAGIEDQLEAMNLAPALQGSRSTTRHILLKLGISVAFGASLAEAAGRCSRNARNPGSAADANRDAVPQPPMPDDVAHALDALNNAQEAYDMAQQEIVELRYQTFCDWHKFLTAYYSDAVRPAALPEPVGRSGEFHCAAGAHPLNEKIVLAGTLVVKKDTAEADGWTTTKLDLRTNALTPAQPSNATLAVQVILRLKALVDTLIAAKLTEQFEIAHRPAEHFWRPREPVVLLSGPVAVSTPRHGEDGDLACAVLAMPDAPGTAAFINAMDTLKPTARDDPSLQTQSSSPWHPIILEWSVSVQPVSAGRQANPAINNTLDYASTFVTGSFQLQDNAPDISPPKALPVGDRDTYEGRCVMTPTASTQLDTNLRNFLDQGHARGLSRPRRHSGGRLPGSSHRVVSDEANTVTRPRRMPKKVPG